MYRPAVPMATTDTRHMPALRPAITDLAISITVFSWASAHGPTGATVTDGAATASTGMVEEDITAEVGATPIKDIQAANQAGMAAAGPTHENRKPILMSKRPTPVLDLIVLPTPRPPAVTADLMGHPPMPRHHPVRVSPTAHHPTPRQPTAAVGPMAVVNLTVEDPMMVVDTPNR
jgi:hypothetical protein